MRGASVARGALRMAPITEAGGQVPRCCLEATLGRQKDTLPSPTYPLPAILDSRVTALLHGTPSRPPHMLVL